MEKKTAKKLLILTILLFCATFLVSACLVYPITLAGRSNIDFTNLQMLLVCLGSAVIPTGSFVGFFTSFSKIKEVTKPLTIAICVLFPLTLVGITIYGIIAIIPCVIKCIITLAKK